MGSIPEEWEQREREAYWAWKKGDETGLIKACEPQIRSLAKSIAKSACRNRSNGLRRTSQYDRFQEGRQREAAFAQEDLREAKEVVDFDDLYSVGCDALLDSATRYDPKRGKSPQAFAYKRIRGAMIDLLVEKQKRKAEHTPGGFEAVPLNPTEQLVALAGEGEWDCSFVTEQVALFLSGYEELDGWREFIQGAPFEIVRFFWWFPYQYADELDLKMNKAKRVKMLGVATWRYWYLRLKAAADNGAKPVKISGPAHMEYIERQRKARRVYPVKVDNKPMGRALGPEGKPIAGDTIAQWRERMVKAGAPPFMQEDGSFSLNSQKEFDAFYEYFMQIVDPRAWRRLERRRQGS